MTQPDGPPDAIGDTPTTPPPVRDAGANDKTVLTPIEVPGTIVATTMVPPAPAPAPSAAPAPAPAAAPAPAPAPAPAGVPAPAPSPAPVPAGRRWAIRAGVGLGALLVLLAVGPWFLSRTVLAALIRPWLAQGAQAGGLGQASLGWTDGVALTHLLVPSPREGATPWVLVEHAHVEVGLLTASLAGATGGTVPLKLVLGPTRVTFDQADLAPATSATATDTPPAEPAPPKPPGSDVLPCTIEPELVVERVDVVLRLAPDPAQSPLRVELRGLSAGGRVRVDRKGGVELLPQGDGPASLSVKLEELRVEAERPEVLTGPIVAVAPHVTLDALSLPADDPAAPRPVTARLTLSARFELDSLTVEGTTLTDVALTLTVKDGACALGLRSSTRTGRFEGALGTDLRPLLRRPSTIDLALRDVEVSGRLARAVPYVLPLLHATSAATAHGRKPGLPPLTLTARGTVDLMTSSEGAFLLDETLHTLALPDGRLSLGPGSLAASCALDGYTRALAGLDVSGLLGNVVPTDLRFDGAEGKFSFAGGRCTVPQIDLRCARGVDLRLSGDVDLGGDYTLNVRSLLGPDARTPAAPILKAIDKAGGVSLRGNLAKDTVEPVMPDRAAIEQAARDLGLGDVLRGLPIPGGVLDHVPGLGR